MTDPPPPPEQLNYPAAHVPPSRPRRSVRSWVLLLAVWAVGLLIWGVYLIAITYLLTRIL